MTDQKNPPRTREEQIIHLGAHIFVGQKNLTDANCRAARNIDEAEARGRAEALAELRAGAEPIYQVQHVNEMWRDVSGADFNEMIAADFEHIRTLYSHPPIPREAELVAEVERLRDALEYAERWSDRAHTACMGAGPKQALGEMLCGLRDFLRAALAAAPETRA